MPTSHGHGFWSTVTSAFRQRNDSRPWLIWINSGRQFIAYQNSVQPIPTPLEVDAHGPPPSIQVKGHIPIGGLFFCSLGWWEPAKLFFLLT